MHRLPLMHVSSALGAAPALARRSTQRRGIRVVDRIHNHHLGIEARRIEGHGVPRFHPERCGVHDNVATRRIGRAEARVAGRTCACNGRRQVDGATMVGIEDRQRTSAGGRNRKGDRSARAAGSYQQDRSAGRIVPLPLHAEYAA